MFADDTTVYLHETDDFSELQNILEKWCRASGAKFNVAKTEILPIGTKEHRKRVLDTRKMNEEAEPIPPSIRIVADGEHTRTLGAYVGNGVEELTVWTPTVENIKKALKKWTRGKPIQEGLRLTANMEIGGRSQYMTRVQEMPKEVLKALEKYQKKYMWNEKQSRIKVETLHAPIDRGGRKLLDIEARNEAIALRRLQAWCRTGTERPIWAWIADDIIARNVEQYTYIQDDESIVHLGLQNLKPKMESRIAPIPHMIKQMLKAKEQYNVVFNPPALTENAKTDLPVWYHIADLKIASAASTARRARASQTMQNTRNMNWNNLADMRCLRQTHLLSTIGDTLALASRMPTENHRSRRDCKCNTCSEMRRSGCTNPHKCMITAQTIIDALPPKFRPTGEEENTQEQDDQAAVDHQDALLFDKNIAVNKTNDGFRVLEDNNEPENQDPDQAIVQQPAENGAQITVYTDGSCENNGDKNAKAGAGIWYGNNDIRN